MGMIIHTAVSLAEIKAEADCKAQDENKHTAFRLNVIGGAHGYDEIMKIAEGIR